MHCLHVSLGPAVRIPGEPHRRHGPHLEQAVRPRVSGRQSASMRPFRDSLALLAMPPLSTPAGSSARMQILVIHFDGRAVIWVASQHSGGVHVAHCLTSTAAYLHLPPRCHSSSSVLGFCLAAAAAWRMPCSSVAPAVNSHMLPFICRLARPKSSFAHSQS